MCRTGCVKIHSVTATATVGRKGCNTLQSDVEHCCVLSDSAATLFRTNTLATTLMDQYMRMTSTKFVQTAVQCTVNKIMESRQSCEVHTRRCYTLCFLQTSRDEIFDSLCYFSYSIYTSACGCFLLGYIIAFDKRRTDKLICFSIRSITR